MLSVLVLQALGSLLVLRVRPEPSSEEEQAALPVSAEVTQEALLVPAGERFSGALSHPVAVTEPRAWVGASASAQASVSVRQASLPVAP